MIVIVDDISDKKGSLYISYICYEFKKMMK